MDGKDKLMRELGKRYSLLPAFITTLFVTWALDVVDSNPEWFREKAKLFRKKE